ncbi:protein YOP1 [Vairimorpha necatrix]|uniref:Protein YOP1 n=1 Tax=Vairimorpha necatrix TaxID=6039 RepID=A0AAX4JAS6_9MICR
MEDIKNISSKFPILNKIERDLKIPKEYALLASVLLVIILIMSTPIGPIITSLIGVIIPLRETLLVLKQVNPNKDEIRHLLIFWVTFGLLTSLDAYSRFIVSFIPMFYTLKFFLLLYIGPSRFRGSKVVYDVIISKIPERWYINDNGINSALSKADAVAKEAAKKIQEKKHE